MLKATTVAINLQILEKKKKKQEYCKMWKKKSRETGGKKLNDKVK